MREGDRREPADAPGAVDLGGLVEVAGDRLEVGEDEDREEGDAAPELGQDGCPEGRVAVGERADTVGDVPLLGEDVREADGRVVDEQPDGRGEHTRDGPGGEHQGAGEGTADEGLVDDEGESQAEDHLQADLDDDPLGGELERVPEQRVAEHLLVVAQAHPAVHPRLVGVVLVQARPHDGEDGVGDEHRDERQRRGQQQVGGPASADLAPEPGRAFDVARALRRLVF